MTKIPDFEFQPWERLIPQVVDGAADARLERDGKAWLFRKCGPLWFVRELSQLKSEWHYGLDHFLVPSDSPVGIWEIPPLEYMLKHWDTDWLRHSCARLFQIVTDKGPVVVAWNLGTGWTAHAGIDAFFCSRRTAPFHLETPASVESLPSSELFALLQTECATPESDARFSVQLAARPAGERAVAGIEFRSGSAQQFAHLMEVTLRALSNKWPPDASTMEVTASVSGGSKKFALEPDTNLGVRERAILSHIIRAFEPRQPLDSPTLPTAIRFRVGEGLLSQMSFSAERPSYHGFMEALVELREWLEENWPEGVRHLGKVV